MGIREDLSKNIRMFLSSADLVYERGDYTSATVLYFKALFAILDYIILNSGKGVPKDHSERFRVLESSAPKLYTVLDKLYPTYRSSYTLSVGREKCDVVRRHVRKLAEEYKISE